MRIAIVAALISVAPSAACADHVDRIDILEAGLYSVCITHRSTMPHDPAVSHLVDKVTLQQRTSIAPGRLGIWFGLRYRLEGKPKGSAVPVRLVTRFPTPGIRYPRVKVARL